MITLLRKENEFVLYETYAEIICLDKFKKESGRLLINLDDIDKCIKYRWCISQNRGASRSERGKLIQIHRLIMDCIELKENEFIDHKNRNKLDNRKENLRFVNNQQNSFNSSVNKNNTSGLIGVRFDKQRNKWSSELMLDNCWKLKKRYTTKQHAIISRLEAELKYFGAEFAPQRHLFEEYGITAS